MLTKKNTFTLIVLLILLYEYSYSQNSIPQSLSIEAKTNYYLRENLECREVVKARDTTISDLKQVIKLQERAIKLSETKASIAQRITASYIDSVEALNSSLNNQVIATKKENNRKKNWRKATLFESLILIGIGILTYTSLAL